MQVERLFLEQSENGSGERVSNTWVTCPREGDNLPKGELIPLTPLESNPGGKLQE